MTMKDEALKLALEALKQIDEAMPFPVAKLAQKAIREALNQPEQNEFNPDWDAMAVMVEEQQRMAKRIAELEAQQEPVAWLHTKIEGVAVPHRPADLDKHPDRWEALYKTPPPCPTCEALARTVMLDQTYHDAQRKPLSNQKIIEMYNEPRSDAEMIEFARTIEAAHGIWPENSDCHGPDWTDRDGEYLK